MINGGRRPLLKFDWITNSPSHVRLFHAELGVMVLLLAPKLVKIEFGAIVIGLGVAGGLFYDFPRWL